MSPNSRKLSRRYPEIKLVKDWEVTKEWLELEITEIREKLVSLVWWEVSKARFITESWTWLLRSGSSPDDYEASIQAWIDAARERVIDIEQDMNNRTISVSEAMLLSMFNYLLGLEGLLEKIETPDAPTIESTFIKS